ADPMPPTFDQLVRTVAARIGPHLHGRFGFYGQSFGGLLAFEVARALPRGWRPEVVIAASATPPDAWEDSRPSTRDAATLLRLSGMGHLVHAEPELRDLALAAIRADLDVCA